MYPMPISIYNTKDESKSRMYRNIMKQNDSLETQREIQVERAKEDEVTLNENIRDFKFGIYDEREDYKALILETKEKEYFVVGEMKKEAIWMKPQKKNYPMKCISRWTQCKVFSGCVLEIDSYDDCSMSIYEITRKYCMVPGFEDIIACNITEEMKNQKLLRQNFKVPMHLENIISFVATTATYIRIVDSFAAMIRDLSVESDIGFQQDAVYLSCALIKILEDAFYQSKCVTKAVRTTEAFKRIEWFIGKDEVTLVELICEEVKTVRTMSINSSQMDEYISLHALCLHWVACRYDKDRDIIPPGKPSFLIELHRLGQSFLETGIIEEVFHDKDLSVIDLPYSVETHNDYDRSSSKLFHKMMESISREELFVLLEASLMSASPRISVNGILSLLVFLHEIKGLPFSALRGLNYSQFLTRNLLSTSRDANPDGFLPGDNLSVSGYKEPTKSWLQKIWPESVPSLNQQETQSVVTAVTMCPELAKLRLTMHYDQARDNFRKDYDKELALSDINFIVENILLKSLTEVKTYSDACTKGMSSGLIAAYAYEAVGGPFNEIKDCYVSSMRDSRVVQDLLLHGLPFPPDDLSSIINDYKHAINCEWDAPNSFKPFIEEEDWTYAAAASLLMKEIFIVYKGIGSFPRAEDGGEGQKMCIYRWLHEKHPILPLEDGFKVHLLEKNTTQREECAIDHHLYRHNPVSVDNSFPTRSFHAVKSLDEMQSESFASLSPCY